jgi:CPA2 family monovalent cation:H+ antiporter-2
LAILEAKQLQNWGQVLFLAIIVLIIVIYLKFILTLQETRLDPSDIDDALRKCHDCFMEEMIFLRSLVIILGISAFVVFALHRLKIPSVVGFLLAGMLLGPHGLNVVKDLHIIQSLAEIGVVLLLFTIGLEFSLSRFLKMKMEVFGIGGLQVLFTIFFTAFMAYQFFGISERSTAIFLGFLVALSSTAIVMKLLSDKAEIDSPHGRISIGTLIFQDLCVVPFMLFIPILEGGAGLGEIMLATGKAAAIIAVVLFSARWVVPFLLHQIVRTRNRELFVLSILIICFGIAFITSEFGLSLALGAFLAGLVISESEYSYEAISTILPFKDSFTGLFFISVGMLMNMTYFINNLPLVLVLFAGIILLKFVCCFSPMYILKRPLRISIQSSLDLAQVGEFSFVLAVAGLSAGLISRDIYQGFLSAAILTMLLTPFVMQMSPLLAGRMSSHNLLVRLERLRSLSEHDEYPARRSGHIIVVGFGLNGRNLTKVLREVEIPYVILELNINTVKEMKEQGEPIYFGDASKVEVLHRTGVKTARILVVAISDPATSRNIVKTARMENSELFIIARTRYSSEVDELIKLGADEVIPEEFETSVEIFSRVLNQYQIPKNEIFNYADMIREDGYRALRQTGTTVRKPLFDKCTVLAKVDFELFTVRENLPVLGKSIGELRFRAKTGATIVAVERDNRMITSPDPEFSLEAGDILFVTGKRENMNKALLYLTEGHV